MVRKTPGLPPPATPTKAPPQTWNKTGTSQLGVREGSILPALSRRSNSATLSLRPTQRWPQFPLPGPSVFRLCSWEARGVRGPEMSRLPGAPWRRGHQEIWVQKTRLWGCQRPCSPGRRPGTPIPQARRTQETGHPRLQEAQAGQWTRPWPYIPQSCPPPHQRSSNSPAHPITAQPQLSECDPGGQQKPAPCPPGPHTASGDAPPPTPSPQAGCSSPTQHTHTQQQWGAHCLQ